MDIIKILLWIMIILIILITFFLCFIYIKSKSFHSYPCYLNIILSFSILMDNLLRLILKPDPKDKDWVCYVQAIGLAFFDKLTVIIITINAYLTYVGFVHYRLYVQYIKRLFFTPIVIGLLIAIIYTTIFILEDEPMNKSNLCYVKTTESQKNTDFIIAIILATINFFCIINTSIRIVNIIKKVKEYRKIDDYVRHYYRIILSLFINAAIFLIIVLIVSESLPPEDDFIDLCYITSTLIVDLFYTFNKTVVNEVKKLFGVERKEEKEEEMPEDYFSQENDGREYSLSEL